MVGTFSSAFARHSFPFLALLLFTLVPCTFGQDVIVSGFEDHVEQAKDDAQHQPEWCWAATIHTILDYYDIHRSQEEIVLFTYGAPVDLPARSPEQLFRTLNNVKFGQDGVEIVRSQFALGKPSLDWVANELAHNHPVLMWLNMGGGAGHAIVVYGMEQNTAVVDIFDPWPGRGLIKLPRFQLSPLVVCYFAIRGAKAQPHAGKPAGGEPQRANGGKAAPVAPVGDFSQQIKTLVKACKADFLAVRTGPSETSEENTTYKCSISIQGALDTKVWIYKDRTLGDEVRAELLDRGKQDDADTKFSEYVDKVKGAFPNWTQSSSSFDNYRSTNFNDPEDSSHTISISFQKTPVGCSVTLKVSQQK